MTSDPSINLEFLAGGGVMGERIRALSLGAYPVRRTSILAARPANGRARHANDTTSDVHLLGP